MPKRSASRREPAARGPAPRSDVVPPRQLLTLRRMVAARLADAARWGGQGALAAGLEDGTIKPDGLPSDALGPEVPVPADVEAMLQQAAARWDGLHRLGLVRQSRADYAYAQVRDEISRAFEALEVGRAHHNRHPVREIRVDYVEAGGRDPSQGERGRERTRDDEDLSGGGFDEQFSAWAYRQAKDPLEEGNALVSGGPRERADPLWNAPLAQAVRDELLAGPLLDRAGVAAAYRRATEGGIERLLVGLHDPKEALARFDLRWSELSEQELETLESRGFAHLDDDWPSWLALPSAAVFEGRWEPGPRAPYFMHETSAYDRRRIGPADRHALARAGFVFAFAEARHAAARKLPAAPSQGAAALPGDTPRARRGGAAAEELGARWRWAGFLERCASEAWLSAADLEILRFRESVALLDRARLAGVSVPTMYRREQEAVQRAATVWRREYPDAPLPDPLLRRRRHVPRAA